MSSEAKKSEILKRVEEVVAPILEYNDMELVDLEYKRERVGMVLRLYIDKIDGGITIDECAQLSREIGDILDMEDMLPTSYNLEVSSPGLDRPLRKTAHFEKAIGSEIKVQTKLPIEGRRRFKGVLVEAGEDRLVVEVDGRKVAIERPQVERANLVYKF